MNRKQRRKKKKEWKGIGLVEAIHYNAILTDVIFRRTRKRLTSLGVSFYVKEGTFWGTEQERINNVLSLITKETMDELNELKGDYKKFEEYE